MAVGCADQAGFRPKALPERCFLLRPLGVELHRWVQQLLLLQLQSNRQVLLRNKFACTTALRAAWAML